MTVSNSPYILRELQITNSLLPKFTIPQEFIPEMARSIEMGIFNCIKATHLHKSIEEGRPYGLTILPDSQCCIYNLKSKQNILNTEKEIKKSYPFNSRPIQYAPQS